MRVELLEEVREHNVQREEHHARRQETEGKTVEASQYKRGLEDAEINANGLERGKRATSKGGSRQVELTSGFKQSELRNAKGDVDAANLAGEMKHCNASIHVRVHQLNSKNDEVTKEREMETEYKRADVALCGAIADVTKLRADLSQAEKEALVTEEEWRNWYEDLEEGINESRSSTKIWGRLCDKMSRTYVASQVPGSAITDAEMAEATKVKVQEESEGEKLQKIIE